MNNASSPRPVIVWFSDPVGPDETILLQGEDFCGSAVVEVALVAEDFCGGAPDGSTLDWVRLEPLQRSSQCLKAVVPETWPLGLFACRVRQGELCSELVVLNAPDPWWNQGDEGNGTATPGGWLRILGKCLDLGTSRIALKPSRGDAIPLPVTASSPYSLMASVPEQFEVGDYEVRVHNGAGGEAGWRSGGALRVVGGRRESVTVFNVLDFGADPDGRNDCTVAIVQAMEGLAALGGGVVYFPRGRYRIDSILRSGMWISHPIKIPRGVTLRGESADLVTLWWPDQKEPLPTLIEGGSDFGVEDLSIYTQGRHRNIISGESNARIRRLRIRANCYYMTKSGGREHHRRGVSEQPENMGAAFEFWGENVQITDCDIYHSAVAFALKHLRGAWIARNTVRAMNMVALSGGQGVIFEENTHEGNQLTSSGNNIALHFGAVSCRHVYYGYNRVSHIYGTDHEALTLDGHGTAYIGPIAKAEGLKLELASDPVLGVDGSTDNLRALDGTTVFILEGRGAGQYRAVVSHETRDLEIDRAWLVPPDASSVVSIGAFNGRHLIIGNIATDAGAVVQLYPPNFECIVAENESHHSSGMSSLSKLGVNDNSRFFRVEPSWYNQFLDNRVVWGNGWGGGETEVDRWIGGEGSLSIWGWQVAFSNDQGGSDQDRLLTPEALTTILPGTESRKRSIPLSRGQIVRRHRIDNNSSIRIRGVVSDVIVEKCVIHNARQGLRVDHEPLRTHCEGIDMLHFEPEQTPPPPGTPPPFLSPEGILLRKNEIVAVRVPLAGTALEQTEIL